MSQAIGQVLAFAVGVALSPIPIIGVVLMLGTPRARANGLAFIAGWVTGLAVLGTAVLLLAGGTDASNSGEPATWVDWLKLVLGVALLLTVGAAAAIAQTGASAGAQAVALAVFVVIGTLGPVAPVALYFALGERSAEKLESLRTWMAAHNAAIMAVLCLVIGAKLIGDAIAGL